MIRFTLPPFVRDFVLTSQRLLQRFPAVFVVTALAAAFSVANIHISDKSTEEILFPLSIACALGISLFFAVALLNEQVYPNRPINT